MYKTIEGKTKHFLYILHFLFCVVTVLFCYRPIKVVNWSIYHTVHNCVVFIVFAKSFIMLTILIFFVYNNHVCVTTFLEMRNGKKLHNYNFSFFA